MKIWEVTNEAGFLNLRKDWDNLLQVCPSPSIYMSFEWMYTWWRHFARGQLLILVAESNGQVRCIAPFMRTSERFLGMQYTRIRFIGSEPRDTVRRNLFDRLFSIDRRYGWPDMLDFLYPQDDIEGLRAILKYLKQQSRRWDILDLRDFPGAAFSLEILRSILGDNGFLIGQVAAKSATVALVGDFESYRKSRRKNWRKNITQTYNRIKKLPHLAFRIYSSPAQVADRLTAIMDLEQRSWQGTRGVGAFSKDSTRRFHRELAESLTHKGRFVLYTVETAGRIICYQYAFVYHRRLVLHSTAMDPSFRYYSPGFYLQLRLIEQAFCQRLERIVLGKGLEDYKGKLKNAEEDRIWVTVFGTRSVPKALSHIEFAMRPRLKQLLRRSGTVAETDSK